MKENRQFKRFPLELHAKCNFPLKNSPSVDCVISEISRTGIGVQLHMRDSIAAHTQVKLEIDIPSQIKPVAITVMLKWVTPNAKADFMIYDAGGELIDIASEVKSELLEYGYNNWMRTQEEL